MAEAPTGGYDNYVQYGKETTYGTEATTIATAFGHDLTVTPEPINNFIESRDLNERNVVKFLEGNFEGTITIEGDLGTSHWMAAGIGTSATAGSAPYEHTYTEANTLPSITIEDGTNLDTDSIRKYLGCKLHEWSISGATGEKIRFRQVWFYKTESEGTTLDGTPATDAETPFTMGQMTLERPDATALANIQRFTFTMTNNLIRVYGAGSRFVTNIITGPRTYTLEYDKTLESSSEYEAFAGSATGPNATVAETSADINITNGGAGSAERHIQITLAGVKFERLSSPKRPNELLVETISAVARAGTFVAQDNTATTIFD